jgi:hypothetical protein
MRCSSKSRIMTKANEIAMASIALTSLIMATLLPLLDEEVSRREEYWLEDLESFLKYSKSILSKSSPDIEYEVLSQVFKKILITTFNMKVFDNMEMEKIGILKTALKMSYMIAIKVLLEIPEIIECATGIQWQDLTNCSIEILFMLVEYGVEFDKNNLFYRASCEFDGFKKARYLLEIGADIHFGNEKALFKAIKHNRIDAIRFLLENGADIHVENEMPLIKAMHSNQIEIVRLLLENGANAKTVSHLRPRGPDRHEISRLLRENRNKK